MTPLVPFDPSMSWAARITTAWQKSVAAIIETGQLLLAAKAGLPHGAFQAMVKLELPFDQRTAQRLMAIAGNPILAKATHVPLLPPSWTTLYELTKLDDDVLAASIENGAINPRMERKDVAVLRGGNSAGAPVSSAADPFAAADAIDEEIDALLPQWLAAAESVLAVQGVLRRERLLHLMRRLKAIYDRAASWERRFHLGGREAEWRQVYEVRWRAARKIGRLLIKSLEAGLRTPGRSTPGTQVGSDTSLLSLEDFGLTRTQSRSWQPLALLHDEEFKRLLALGVNPTNPRHESPKGKQRRVPFPKLGRKEAPKEPRRNVGRDRAK